MDKSIFEKDSGGRKIGKEHEFTGKQTALPPILSWPVASFLYFRLPAFINFLCEDFNGI
jgi:hypothetical protein